jgi:hypothetical protein
MATNGNISVSTDFGFGPIQTVFAPNSAIIANTTPSTYESAAVSILTNLPRVIGDDYTNLTQLAPFTYNSAIITNTTLAESTTVSILTNLPRVIGDDYTNLTQLAPSATITYAVTDGVPIVTGTTSNQQYWN